MNKEILDLQEKLRTLRFKAKVSPNKNTKEYSVIKKSIARLLTASVK